MTGQASTGPAQWPCYRVAQRSCSAVRGATEAQDDEALPPPNEDAKAPSRSTSRALRCDTRLRDRPPRPAARPCHGVVFVRSVCSHGPARHGTASPLSSPVGRDNLNGCWAALEHLSLPRLPGSERLATSSQTGAERVDEEKGSETISHGSSDQTVVLEKSSSWGCGENGRPCYRRRGSSNLGSYQETVQDTGCLARGRHQ